MTARRCGAPRPCGPAVWRDGKQVSAFTPCACGAEVAAELALAEKETAATVGDGAA